MNETNNQINIEVVKCSVT